MEDHFVSPERTDQIDLRIAKGARGGRPPAFDAELYKQRNVVERCFNRLRQFRDLATRYAKRVTYYQAELAIAAIALCGPPSRDRCTRPYGHCTTAARRRDR